MEGGQEDGAGVVTLLVLVALSSECSAVYLCVCVCVWCTLGVVSGGNYSVCVYIYNVITYTCL